MGMVNVNGGGLDRDAPQRSRSANNPFALDGTALSPGALLAAQLAVVAFVVVRGGVDFPEPYLPFVGFLDDIGSPQLLPRVLEVAWVIAAVMLFAHRYPRVACGVLGTSILISILSMSASGSNNLTFTGLLFILVALSDRQTASLIVRWQLVILYFWAGLNKLLDVDWRTGDFFEVWNGTRSYGHEYLQISSWLPGASLSVISSWGVIVTEFLLAVGFTTRRWTPAAALGVVAYHSSLLLLTNSTFTLFWFVLIAACLVAVEWPPQGGQVDYGRGKLGSAGMFFAALIWEGPRLAPALERRAHVQREAASDQRLGSPREDRPLHPWLWMLFFVAVAVTQQRRWAAVVALATVASLALPPTLRTLRARAVGFRVGAR